MISIKDSIGDVELLQQDKTAFLCSRKIPASVVLRCYDWAIAQRERGRCVISGFHSKLEKDVLHYLIKGHQPIIVVLARGLKDHLEPVLKKAIDSGRLLIITPFDRDTKRVTELTAARRNQLMADLADEIIVGYASEEGKLQKILREHQGKVQYLLN